MLNTVNVELKTDIKTDRPTALPIKLMSQDKNNNQFILRFTSGGEIMPISEAYTVEILTKFQKSGASRLTSATVLQDYAAWEFDTDYITQDETVYNYVYVRKAGNLIVSADSNAFFFEVGVSEIDKDAGRVAEVYDENYQKYLDEFKENVDFEEIAQAESDRQANEDVRQANELLREENYNQKVDTAIVEADVVAKVDNKVTELAPQISNLTAQLAQITQQLEDGTAGIDDTVVSTDKVWSSARTKEELANIVDGSPKGGFATKTDLQNIFPTGTTGVYVVVEDNNWYYWNGTTWTAGGSYLNGGYYTFTETSQTVNVFDKTKATDGGYYSDISPYNWISNATIGQTAFIPVKQGDVVRINPSISNNYILVFKNSEGAIFASTKKTDGIIGTYSTTAPANAFSVSSAFYLSEKDKFMMTVNNPMPTEYVSYSGATIKAIEPTFKNAVSDLLGTVSEKGNYDGKYLSILGDSISTFSGWIPSGNAVFYSGSNYGVTSVDQTWWKRLMNQTGMELCVNNSWSGSRVTTTNGTDSAGCMTRATSLHTTTKNPDVIIVYLGINDFNNEVTLGAYDGTTAFPTNTTTFKEAYAIMLSKILTQYKNAEVYVCTLPDCERNGVITFPEINDSGVLLAEWNNAIRELAGLFSLPILEMDKSGLTFYNKDVYLSDNLHPNSSGHKLLANKAIKTIDPAAKFSTVA